VLLTNAHVVSQPRYRGPRLNGLLPEEVSVRFEGAAILDRYDQIHKVEKLLWTSSVEEFDCTILLLTPEPANLDPLKVTLELPVPAGDRVYVIGYPGGGELSLSLQDTELIDLDRPPFKLQSGRKVCRLRYTTPTEPGSSGSPVFSGPDWDVVALHHAGGSQMAKLNGEGFEAANEGIALGSILDALSSTPSS
jgi:V8-like Glu-specific endopeptidase